MKQHVRWLGGGFWAVMDQGLLATSNFVISVLLARWLSPQEYGAFATAYAVLWVIMGFHQSILTEPMAVFGSGKYKGRSPEYLGALLYGHLGFSVIGGVLLLLLSAGLALSGSTSLPSALLGVAFTGPFILFFRGVIRQACYIDFKPRLAALGGASYMVLILPGAYFLYQHNWLSAVTGFGLMGFASLISGLWLVVFLRVSHPPLTGKGLFSGVLKDHWRYGRWATPSNVLSFISYESYLLLLPIWGGLDASAVFRALTNLITPVMQGVSALSLFLLPTLVRTRGHSEFGSYMRLALTLFIVGSGCYWLLLGLFHRPLVAWLYAGQYERYADLLWLIGLMPLLKGLVNLLSTGLRALEQPDQIFRAQVLSSAVTLTVGLGLLITWGVVGAVAGSIVSQIAAVVALAWLLWRSKRGGEGDHVPRDAEED